MPMFRYTNATDATTNRFTDLCSRLVKNHPDQTKVKSLEEAVINAHVCSMVEVIVNSFELQQGFTYDPVIVREIRDLLQQCK